MADQRNNPITTNNHIVSLANRLQIIAGINQMQQATDSNAHKNTTADKSNTHSKCSDANDRQK